MKTDKHYRCIQSHYKDTRADRSGVLLDKIKDLHLTNTDDVV